MIDFFLMVSIWDLIYNDFFDKILSTLGIDIDVKELEKTYDCFPRGQGDAFVFRSQVNENILFLDLFEDPTDQNEMVGVGVRCAKCLEDIISKLLGDIHEEVPVKSEEIKVGAGILNDILSPDSYPKKIPTITYMDEKTVYEYHQKLIIF